MEQNARMQEKEQETRGKMLSLALSLSIYIYIYVICIYIYLFMYMCVYIYICIDIDIDINIDRSLSHTPYPPFAASNMQGSAARCGAFNPGAGHGARVLRRPSVVTEGYRGCQLKPL